MLGWELTLLAQSLLYGCIPPISFCQGLLIPPAGPLGQDLGQSHTGSHSLVAHTGSRETIRHFLPHKP